MNPSEGRLVVSGTVASLANVTTSLLIAPHVPDAVVKMKGTDRRVVMMGLGAVLISVLLGSAFAIGPGGPLPSPLDAYVTDWFTQTGTMSDSGLNDQVVEFTVREANVTTVVVRLTWTDDERVNPLGRRDDTLTMRVEGPSVSGLEEEVSGTSGDLELRFNVATVPSDDDANNIGDYMDENGTGDWRVTVSVLPAGFRDTGNDWAVSLQYTYYTGRLIDNPEVV
jgi:hypothetical protein